MLTSQALSSVENLLSQMRAVARASQGGAIDDTASVDRSQGGFAAELARSLKRVSQADQAASAQAQAFELGDRGVSLSQVMLDLQKANLSFQATVQVRNRLVEAYKEVANMAI